MDVSVKDVTSLIGQKQLLRGMNLTIDSGEVVGIIGPNGSGKSTLLKNMSRIIPPNTGLISLDGGDISDMSSKVLAKNLAVVSQDSTVSFDFTVREIVLMGRSPHKGFLESDTKYDQDVVDSALERVGMQNFGQRSFSTLSGGEKQRVMIARAIAQEAKVLLLDEPTNHLDIHHQIQIMDLIRELNITVITALHDLNIAAAYCDRIYVVQKGEIVAHGTPKVVLTPALLKDIFQVCADVRVHPLTNKIHITYLSDRLSIV